MEDFQADQVRSTSTATERKERPPVPPQKSPPLRNRQLHRRSLTITINAHQQLPSRLLENLNLLGTNQLSRGAERLLRFHLLTSAKNGRGKLLPRPIRQRKTDGELGAVAARRDLDQHRRPIAGQTVQIRAVQRTVLAADRPGLRDNSADPKPRNNKHPQNSAAYHAEHHKRDPALADLQIVAVVKLPLSVLTADEVDEGPADLLLAQCYRRVAGQGHAQLDRHPADRLGFHRALRTYLQTSRRILLLHIHRERTSAYHPFRAVQGRRYRARSHGRQPHL